MSSLLLARPLISRMLTLYPARLQHWLGMAARTRRTRRALARLDTALLKDIGLEPHHVAQEIARPFWNL